jgi:hypothetical protein
MSSAVIQLIFLSGYPMVGSSRTNWIKYKLTFRNEKIMDFNLKNKL